VLFGAGAWRLFKNAPNVRSRFVAAGDYAIPNVTPAQATTLLVGNPEVRTSYMVAEGEFNIEEPEVATDEITSAPTPTVTAHHRRFSWREEEGI
jgi:hypothetical protein